MKNSEILRKAKELIGAADRWTQNNFPQPFRRDPKPTAYNMRCAIAEIVNLSFEDEDAPLGRWFKCVEYLDMALEARGASRWAIKSFLSDKIVYSSMHWEIALDRTHEDVMKLMDEAVALAEQEEKRET